MIRCNRPGCQRPSTRATKCCSSACRAAWLESEAAKNLLDHLGNSGPVDAFVIAAEHLNHALTEVHARRAELETLAAEAGWGADTFDKLIRGQLAVAQQDPDTGTPADSVDPRPDADTK